jgi:hypothetical protein
LFQASFKGKNSDLVTFENVPRRVYGFGFKLGEVGDVGGVRE